MKRGRRQREKGEREVSVRGNQGMRGDKESTKKSERGWGVVSGI